MSNTIDSMHPDKFVISNLGNASGWPELDEVVKELLEKHGIVKEPTAWISTLDRYFFKEL